MLSYNDKQQLPYPQDFLFHLVADVAAYPDFLPWCQNAEIHTASENHIDATLDIGYAFLKESFRSHVFLSPATKIHTQYVEGPFEHLENTWIFDALSPTQTSVSFTVSFVFDNTFLQQAISKVFNQATKMMMDAFEKRAQNLWRKQQNVKKTPLSLES